MIEENVAWGRRALAWRARVADASAQEGQCRAKDEEKQRSLAEWVAGAAARAEAAAQRKECVREARATARRERAAREEDAVEARREALRAELREVMKACSRRVVYRAPRVDRLLVAEAGEVGRSAVDRFRARRERERLF